MPRSAEHAEAIREHRLLHHVGRAGVAQSTHHQVQVALSQRPEKVGVGTVDDLNPQRLGPRGHAIHHLGKHGRPGKRQSADPDTRTRPPVPLRDLGEALTQLREHQPRRPRQTQCSAREGRAGRHRQEKREARRQLQIPSGAMHGRLSEPERPGRGRE